MPAARLSLAVIGIGLVLARAAVGEEAPAGAATTNACFVRAVIGPGYEAPVYVHLYADNWAGKAHRGVRGHYALLRTRLLAGAKVRSARAELLRSGQTSDWVNIEGLLFSSADVKAGHRGARLEVSLRYDFYKPAEHIDLRLDFATAPEAAAIVRTVERRGGAAAGARLRPHVPMGFSLIVPSSVREPARVADGELRRLFGRPAVQTDADFAAAAGARADAMTWPSIGRPPRRFPFFVSANIGGAGVASLPEVVARERQTLDRFGFTAPGRLLKAGLWPNLGGPDNRCYHQPVVRLEGSRRNMTDQAAREAAAFRAAGTAPESIACCLLTDEPAGQKLEHLVVCPACLDAFRGWLKGLALSPADLLVADWEAVRFVPPEQRDDAPALHYFTQRFRTRALAEFIAVQTEILRAAYGFDFPMAASISGGNAVYGANFYIQGVDYFELLGHPGVNALWSADWANDASTYQMGAYNAALLQAAARRHGQALGMHVVAQAGRLPWDVKCKAVGQAARGIGMLNSFHYGPTYACGERYPWIANPEMWAPHAEVVREIGAAEDLLLAGRPVPAEVAIVYSSSSDIWTLQRNHAYGFERKHIWLALTHAQIPVDFLSERDVAEGLLAGYRVCYATGPNLTRAAAAQLREWTLRGGTLVLTAGAAAHDEYNRPVDTLDTLLPCGRRPVVERHPLLTPGRSLGDTRRVPTLDTVRIGEAELEVLSLRGALRAGENARIEGVFADGSPAFVSGARGAGRVYCAGFLPGLAYVRAAWLARVRAGEEDLVAAAVDGVDEAVDGDDADRQPDPAPAAAAGPLALSYNPWAFPAGIREAILAPARAAGVDPPVRCSVPVIDAVLLESETGAVLALANWTIREQAAVAFSVRTAKPVRRAESVHQGALTLQAGGGAEPGGGATVRFTLALRETDFVLFQY